ncbi:hemophore-related protein [Mycolicibacterium iranicum]|uniref:hemophore-related protein n=1 Tax=Mycolicibacterium iranicum TaxID=912594 RepID=UPI000B143AD3|nr:hemophore-related protein [Mycolicibacterium iranicum]
MAGIRVGTSAFAAVIAATVCAVGYAPIAASQPGGPLIDTTCSYEQVDAALSVEAPRAAERLRNRPDAQAKAQALLALPVAERRAKVNEFLDRNPDVRRIIETRRDTPQGQDTVAKLQRVAQTCHNY